MPSRIQSTKLVCKEAAEIYEKEAGNSKPLVNVQFDTKPESDYNIFTNDTETLYVNPETKEVGGLSLKSKNYVTILTFSTYFGS